MIIIGIDEMSFYLRIILVRSVLPLKFAVLPED